MCPYITLFGKDISTYGIMVAAGIILAIVYLKARSKRAGLSIQDEGDAELALIFSAIGTVAGAKLLYLAVSVQEIAQDLQNYDLSVVVLKYVGSGFVFYGGLIGAITGLFLFALRGKHTFEWYCRLMVPIIPLFHCCGRIGCFLEGCCYGIESDLFGIAFTNSEIAPNGVSLIPVQLIEAVFEIVLFIILTRQKDKNGLQLLAGFICAYAPIRFILEFLRGDDYRGIIFGISLSQIISVILIVCTILLSKGLLKLPEKKRKFLTADM